MIDFTGVELVEVVSYVEDRNLFHPKNVCVLAGRTQANEHTRAKFQRVIQEEIANCENELFENEMRGELVVGYFTTYESKIDITRLYIVYCWNEEI